MKGRKPVPTALKILRGNPGKRPLNDSEPKPRSTPPEMPPHLDEEAAAEWGRLIPELSAMGVVTIVDRGVLAAYCCAWSRWVKAERFIQRSGEVLKAKDGGGMYQNPYLSVANRAMDQMQSLGALLGLDPSNRSRLNIAPTEKKRAIETRERA